MKFVFGIEETVTISLNEFVFSPTDLLSSGMTMAIVLCT